ncbi:type II toxin-antitoxin system RelE/ParE family toxin [Glycocaulis profundi]|nr:type II toxin-antitoxin system RelE/ParE family toxin [Glycocaulis profundi]
MPGRPSSQQARWLQACSPCSTSTSSTVCPVTALTTSSEPPPRCELFGVQQAERYAADLRTAIGHLSALPEMGRLDTDILPPARRLACGVHVVWYDVTGQSVIIQRITHERMLPPSRPTPDTAPDRGLANRRVPC